MASLSRSLLAAALRPRADRRRRPALGAARRGTGCRTRESGAHRRRDRRLPEGGRREPERSRGALEAAARHPLQGAYVAASNDDKKKIYADAKKAGDDALAVVDRALRAKGVTSITKAPEKQVADAARAVPGRHEVFLWDSVNWGEWALAYGKMAAAREGAADRIKREATIAKLVDPKLEGGSPHRVLGRLHDQTPHIPFITGWASSKEAVRFLNESLKIDPTNKITRVFLAEAMVNNDSDTKPQAIQMLRGDVNAPNDPNYEVEQAAANGRREGAAQEVGSVTATMISPVA